MDRLKIGRKHVSNHYIYIYIYIFFFKLKKGRLFLLKSLTQGASKVTLRLNLL